MSFRGVWAKIWGLVPRKSEARFGAIAITACVVVVELLNFHLVTPTMAGQAALGMLVAGVGYFMHQKSNKIEVLVNGRMTLALQKIESQEQLIEAQAVRLARLETALKLSPGEDPSHAAGLAVFANSLCSSALTSAIRLSTTV